MITARFFLFSFYIFTAILTFLGYIFWYILCTNTTLSFVVTCRKQELLTLHIESIDPDYHLHRGYESASHPTQAANNWWTAPQSPHQDGWNPLPPRTLTLKNPHKQTTTRHVQHHQHYTGTMGGVDGDATHCCTKSRAVVQGERTGQYPRCCTKGSSSC